MHTNEETIKVLGITGGVGAGKSTILTYLKERYGAAVILCDDVARELQQKGGACFAPLCSLLTGITSRSYIGNDGEIDRKVLAEVLFEEPSIRVKINALIHPAVKKEVKRRIHIEREKACVPFIVVEAALLLEDHYDEICDEIWYIHADEEVREKRLIASRGYSAEKIHSILKSQLSDEAFRMGTALTIDNSDENVQNTFDQMDKGLRTHGFLQYSQRKQR